VLPTRIAPVAPRSTVTADQDPGARRPSWNAPGSVSTDASAEPGPLCGVNDRRWASRRGGYDATEWPGWLQLRLQLATFAVVRQCSPSPNAQFNPVYGTSTNRAERIMTAWQCGGQGLESPQLHHSNRPFSHPGERPESFSWCHRGGHRGGCCATQPGARRTRQQPQPATPFSGRPIVCGRTYRPASEEMSRPGARAASENRPRRGRL
jgi:hypothetical protein